MRDATAGPFGETLFTGDGTTEAGLPDRTDLGKATACDSGPPAHAPDCISPALVPLPDESKDPVTSLPELCRLLRQQKHQARRCRRIQRSLRSLQTATARTTRLVSAARSIRQTLAECLKAEDKSSFVALLEACYDAFNDSLAPLPTAPDRNADADNGPLGIADSFLDNLSTPARSFILDLVARLRHDGSFIADRLAALTQKEILALLPTRPGSGSHESVLGGPLRTSRSSRPLGFAVDAKLDALKSQSFASPLEVLVAAVRTVSGSGPAEEDRATDVWASVCARLISTQKPGSEKLVPALLDIWASMSPWPEKDKLDLWMMRLLQDGSFLLDQSSKFSFRARAQGRPDLAPEDELRAETFYTKTTESLLDLLTGRAEASVIPPGALKLCHAIRDKLQHSPSHQRAFPHFVVTRWLFSTFIPDMFSLPEGSGLLGDVYIGDGARQRILREVAGRAQKAVFDVAYSWKLGNSVSPSTFERVQAIMDTVQEPQSHHLQKTFPMRSVPASLIPHEDFLVLSINDIVTILASLYPPRQSPSFASDHGPFRSGLQSSASSVSGFSLFQNFGPPAPPPESVHGLLSNGVGKSAVEDRPVDTGGVDEPVDRSVLVQHHDSPLHNDDLARELHLELEDLAATRRPNSHKWAVLVSDPNFKSLLTILDHCSFIFSGNESPPLAEELEPSLQEYPSYFKPLEVLLNRLTQSDEPCAILAPDQRQESIAEVEVQIIQQFQQVIDQCESRSDFVEAHSWYRRLRIFCELRHQALDFADLQDTIRTFEQNAHRCTTRAETLAAAGERWITALRPRAELHEHKSQPILDELRILRNKMWYITDVRTSAVYEESRTIAAALRIMGRAKLSHQSRTAPPTRQWGGSKLSYSNMHVKPETQILELLSAKAGQGGPNKLSDSQSKATLLWIERHNIHNMCIGEERLHKLCMEIRKCVDQLIAPPSLILPSFWSNILFAKDSMFTHPYSTPKSTTLSSGFERFEPRPEHFSFQPPSRHGSTLATDSHSLANASSKDQLSTYSPTLTHKSSAQFWSPAMTEVGSPPSSATSIESSVNRPTFDSSNSKQDRPISSPDENFVDSLRQHLTSLILSDLTSNLFSEGSETDVAFWTGLGGDLADRCLQNKYQSLYKNTPDIVPYPDTVANFRPHTFNFDAAFSRLLQKFTASPNPFKKLGYLYDIDRLLISIVAEHRDLLPRVESSIAPSTLLDPFVPAQSPIFSTDASIDGFQRLFMQSFLRPSTIFRDLQYIAALVPSSVLEHQPLGKAFFNAVFAISRLKQDARTTMVETADSIIAYHSNNRGPGPSASSSVAQQQRDSAAFSPTPRHTVAEEVAQYSMADAAYLLQITAKEGDPVAQRELATLYLTHPELMDHIVAPFARPQEVFKEELEGKWRKNRDPNRCDPATMCVAHHWMSLSSKGGDALATEYLRQREEMDRLP